MFKVIKLAPLVALYDDRKLTVVPVAEARKFAPLNEADVPMLMSCCCCVEISVWDLCKTRSRLLPASKR